LENRKKKKEQNKTTTCRTHRKAWEKDLCRNNAVGKRWGSPTHLTKAENRVEINFRETRRGQGKKRFLVKYGAKQPNEGGQKSARGNKNGKESKTVPFSGWEGGYGRKHNF